MIIRGGSGDVMESAVLLTMVINNYQLVLGSLRAVKRLRPLLYGETG